MTVMRFSKAVTFLALGGASLALSACSDRTRPENLPQAPMGTDGVTGGPGGPGQMMPGSQRDFLAHIMSDRIFFDTNRSNVDAEDAAVLDSQIAWLQQFPNKRIVVEGHCDERGTRDFNLALGARRANAAKNYLVSRGIDPARIQTISYGKERPEATGSDPESWAKNRRAVTVTVQ